MLYCLIFLCTSLKYTLAAFLGNNKYAIVGGAAVKLLGSTRTTEDVDFVVPQGAVAAARTILAAAPAHFIVDPRTRHTHYRTSPPVEIEIVSPPALFRETFNADTPTHTITIGSASIKILSPVLILNSKCRSILGRPTEAKKVSDAADIKFLLRWLATNNAFPTAQDVPNATKEFVEWFIATYTGAEYWTSARYNFQTGGSHFPKFQFFKLTFPINRFVLRPRAHPRGSDCQMISHGPVQSQCWN
ncbi:uncharacterized protein BDR25DRAFT_385324 [Lindgomyces ingoldianus]|uniref:Uncharacterized protein n=1 Tax=Lindgomyces ingoldianus TaxID=673940 RepID=A0ACB6Q9Z2_9PLEO|nr:uncharacterized protein BDR25DRAFT_385324 [Lindgomyces ingoldianus]KAF2462937.1 hypothetical protein BDR25DRAFT_385324 [Lindgomyces ingoldianus]